MCLILVEIPSILLPEQSLNMTKKILIDIFWNSESAVNIISHEL